MQVTQTLNEGLKRGYHFVVPSTVLNDRVEERLAEEQPNVQLNGFRKGKVPISLMRRLFGKGVKDEVRESTVRETLDGHFNDSNERPATTPAINIESDGRNDGEDLSFSVSYETLPTIPEIDFGSIRLERLVAAVDEELIQEQLEKLAARYGNFEAAEAGSKAELGNLMVLDFKGLVDGEEFEQGSGEGFPVELGKGLIAPGLDEQLVGAEVGATVDAKVTYPDWYHVEELRGRDATFSCIVKELKRSVPHSIDDELASMAECESLEDLKEVIRDQLETGLANDSRFLLRYRLFDQLDELLDFDLPPSLLDAEIRNVVQQLGTDDQRESEDREASDGVRGDEGTEADSDSIDEPGRPEEAGATPEQLRIAERRLRLGLLLLDISRSRNIEVTPRDLDQAATRMALRGRGVTKSQYLDLLKIDGNVRSGVEQKILERKVVEFLLELVDVTDREVSARELRESIEAIDETDT